MSRKLLLCCLLCCLAACGAMRQQLQSHPGALARGSGGGGSTGTLAAAGGSGGAGPADLRKRGVGWGLNATQIRALEGLPWYYNW